jgi:hypothetical protein
MPSVYVAGKYTDFATIRENQAKCMEAGFIISYDWTAAAEQHLVEKKKKFPRRDAYDDIDGVLKADWTVLIMTDSEYSYRGTFCELGASITRDIQRGVRRTIIVSDGMVAAGECVFFHHPNVYLVRTITEALMIMKSGPDYL